MKRRWESKCTMVAVRTIKAISGNIAGQEESWSSTFNSRGLEKDPNSFLANFNGILQTDGYNGYDRVGGPKLIHAGCWAQCTEILFPGSGSSSRRSCRDQVGGNH